MKIIEPCTIKGCGNPGTVRGASITAPDDRPFCIEHSVDIVALHQLYRIAPTTERKES